MRLKSNKTGLAVFAGLVFATIAVVSPEKREEALASMNRPLLQRTWVGTDLRDMEKEFSWHLPSAALKQSRP